MQLLLQSFQEVGCTNNILQQNNLAYHVHDSMILETTTLNMVIKTGLYKCTYSKKCMITVHPNSKSFFFSSCFYE